MKQKARLGFTLIEVVAALGLGTLIIGLAAGVLRVLWRADTTLQQRYAVEESVAAANRRLTELFSMVESATPGFRPVHGDSQSMALVTRVRGAWGGIDYKLVELTLSPRTGETVVALRAEGEASAELMTIRGVAAWEFLHHGSGVQSWTESWRSDEAIPGAVRIVSKTDTLTFPLGGHR